MLCWLVLPRRRHGCPRRGGAFQSPGPPAEGGNFRRGWRRSTGTSSARGIKTRAGDEPGPLLTGYSYGEFYDWDLYFENLYLSYYGISDYCFTNFKAFLDTQQPDGFVSRSLRRNGTPDRNTQMFKPFLAQIAVLGSAAARRLHMAARQLLRAPEKVSGPLVRLRRRPQRPAGLGQRRRQRHGQPDQPGRQLGAYTTEGVDLACYLVREEQAMAVIADHLGQKDDAEAFRGRAQALAKQINAVFWDDKDGFYYDRNEKTGQRVRVKSVAGFMPLWAGVAPKDRARRIIREHLLNPNEFWLPYPVAGYAKTEPDYYQGSRSGECNWRGSDVDSNQLYDLPRPDPLRLQRRGRELADKTFHMALDENPVTREYYNAETGGGNGLNPFWGWSTLAYVHAAGLAAHYDPMDLQGTARPLLRQDLQISFVAAAP